jgi:putative ABC transport system substrate-binding protein
MKRRDFIVAIGAAFVGSPRVARAQQPEQTRRIGILMNRAADDMEGQTGIVAFQLALQQLGWNIGLDLKIHVRWGQDDVALERKFAAELVDLSSSIILASGTMSVAAVQGLSNPPPIIFVGVTDPAGAGFVENLAKPGGNVTGFMIFEYGFTAKWVELLKQIEPNIKRAAVIRLPDNPAAMAQFGAIQAAAQSLGVEISAVNARNSGEIERATTSLASLGNAGLIVTPSAGVSMHRDLIIQLAARHKLPAVYGNRNNINDGGLIFYGPNRIDQFRRAAGYVDRVLKGEKPADLPVQAPTKYDLVINLKAARALGLELPASLVARADEVIE